MTVEDAIHELTKIDCGVIVRKLARATLVGDCKDDLRVMLGLTKAQLRPLYGKYPQVGDFPHDVWYCQFKHKRAYGKTFAEAVERALTPVPDKGGRYGYDKLV